MAPDVPTRARGPEAALGAAVLRLVAASEADPGGLKPPADAFALLVREGAALLPGTAGVLLTVGPERDVSIAATTEQLSALLEPFGSGVAGFPLPEVAEAATTLDPAQAAWGDFGTALAAAGVRRVRVIPLPSRGVLSQPVIGVYMACRLEDVDFTPDDEELLAAYAMLVAISVARIRQRGQVDHARQRFELGFDIALDLSRALVPDDVNRRLVARAAGAVAADRATLLRRTDDELLVVSVYDRDDEDAASGVRVSLDSDPLLLRAYETRAEAFARARGQAQAETEDAAAARAVALPLVFGGEVTGFLSVQRRRDEPFSDDDVATLQLIANLAVVTLRNAQFFAENRAAKQVMADFLGTVMHEMRAPLTIVGGYMSMIREGVFGTPPSALERPLATVSGKINEAQGLVDELLLASRLENGDMPYRLIDVDLSDAAQRAAERAAPRAGLLGAHVEVLAPDQAWARADAAHVDRILDNLVNNAMLHGGPDAEVTVEVLGGAHPALSVSDTGDGIPAGEREHIFDRFYRGRDSGSGTGLGLYISRQLADRWGGQLDLDSGAGQGARFVLSLPAAAGS